MENHQRYGSIYEDLSREFAYDVKNQYQEANKTIKKNESPKSKSKAGSIFHEKYPYTTLDVYKILQKGFYADQFITKESTMILTQEENISCGLCKFKMQNRNIDLKTAYSPNEKFWFQGDLTESQEYKSYVLYNLNPKKN